MKLNKTYITGVFLTAAMLVTSCESVQNANNQQKGTAIGTTSGAVIGGILGNNIGRGGNAPLGIVLGGIIGGVTGNVIGKKMDKQAKQIKQTLPGAEVERVGEGIKVTLPESLINFDFNSSDLSDVSKTNLDKLAQVLTDNPDTNINIYGYTDSKGTDEYNKSLSERRAEAVKTYLVSKNVDAARLFTMGMGETNPVASNDTDEGRAKNRRVEFAITANQDMINESKNEQ